MQQFISNLNLFGLLVLSAFIAGCANDSLPPFHSSIQYNPSQSHTFLSDMPPTNAPSTRDWKTNQSVGVGYSTTGEQPAVPTAAGAASTPSAASSGSATGVTSGGAGVSTAPGAGTTAGTAAPGPIIGNPSSTGIIGTSPPAAPPTSTISPGTGLSSPSPGTGFSSNPNPFRTANPPTSTSPTSSGLNGIGFTNTVPGTTFTNIIPAQTNFLPGLNRPQ